MPSTEVRAFRRQGSSLVLLNETQWNAFCSGSVPWSAIEAASSSAAPLDNRLDVLLITCRDGECVLAEPLSLRIDHHGYLQRMYLPLDALPARAGLVDARLPFLKRYLRHAHHWSPTPEQLANAIACSVTSR